MLNPPVLFSLCIALCGVPLAAGLGHPSVPTTWPGGLLVPRSVVLGSLQVAFARPSGLPPKTYLVPSGAPSCASGSVLLDLLVAFTRTPAVAPRGLPGGLRAPLGALPKVYLVPSGALAAPPAHDPRGAFLWSSPGVGVGGPPLANKISFLGVHCDGHCCLLFHVLD